MEAHGRFRGFPAEPTPLAVSVRGLVLLGAGAAVLGVVIAQGWVSDDAFITFRVIDNFVHGHGLRWNVDERVEVYTHPLWMGLLVPFHALWGNLFFTSIAVSVVCTCVALLLAVRAFPASLVATLGVLLLPLALSRAFTQFATSGLENALSYLLFGLFAWHAVRPGRSISWLAVGLGAGLALLNRLDTLFLFAPPLLWLVVQRRGSVHWGALASGFLPLAGWQAFRMLYYGFPFPNTKYAKLDAGIPTAAYVEQGFRYVGDLALRDPVSLAVIVLGPAAALWLWARRRPTRDDDGMLAALGVGVLCYAAYVVRVGGDFMSGRFFALPVFAAAWVLHGVASRVGAKANAGAVLVAALLVALKLGEPALLEVRQAGRWGGITDERAFYAATNTLFDRSGRLRTHVGGHAWVDHGLRLRTGAEPSVLEHGAVGMLGFTAGPEARIVDPTGLTDPLLARLPVERRRRWRIGHLDRAVPAGYLYARETGSLEHMDPDLAAYYARLRRIISGPVFDWERLRTVISFNLDSEPPGR